MKKLLLASAIAALSVSAANAAPTIYGKIFMTADYVDEEVGSSYDENGVQLNSQGSRVGFKGSEPMSANTDVIYQLEYGLDVDADDHKSFKNRDTYLGLNNKTFGEFRVGNNQSTLDYINNVTVTSGFWDNLGSTKLNSEQEVAAFNMADSGRISNSIIWKAPKYQGVPVELAVMYGNEDDIGSDSDGGWGAALMFDQGTGFTAGIAYDKDLNIEGDIIRGTASVDLATLNSGFPVQLGALYQEADYDYGSKKEKGYVVGAEMGLSNFAKPASVYAQYNNTSNLDGIDGFDASQIVVGGKYHYQKNMIAHAYIGQNEADNVSRRSNSGVITNYGDGKVFAFGGGLEYKF